MCRARAHVPLRSPGIQSLLCSLCRVTIHGLCAAGLHAAIFRVPSRQTGWRLLVLLRNFERDLSCVCRLLRAVCPLTIVPCCVLFAVRVARLCRLHAHCDFFVLNTCVLWVCRILIACRMYAERVSGVSVPSVTFGMFFYVLFVC